LCHQRLSPRRSLLANAKPKLLRDLAKILAPKIFSFIDIE